MSELPKITAPSLAERYCTRRDCLCDNASTVAQTILAAQCRVMRMLFALGALKLD